jgi:hypothetical protein
MYRVQVPVLGYKFMFYGIGVEIIVLAIVRYELGFIIMPRNMHGDGLLANTVGIRVAK